MEPAGDYRRSFDPMVRLLWLMALSWLAVAGCSGAPDPQAAVLTDLFDAGAPVRISPTVQHALTARVSDEDAARLGPRAGTVPLADLRAPAGDSGHSTTGFALTTAYGQRLADDVRSVPRTILDTPYWPSIFRRVGARGNGRTFVGTNLLYRIYVYGGPGQLDSIWDPPPSWSQAERPPPGAFTPERAEAWSRYLDGISTMKALAVVADSVLVVSVGPLGPPGDSADDGLRLQVYVAGERIGTDLRAPGELVAYADRSLFFLNRSPDRAGATVTEYTWRDTTR